jgi:hypothetical protein
MDRWQGEIPEGAETHSRTGNEVLEEWRDWMIDYQNSHIEYENSDGEIARAPLRNSYQNKYAKKYYARMQDFKRSVEREFESVTAVMLTFTASHLNRNGKPRCIGDHLRDIIDGWSSGVKQSLHRVLSGYTWEYARIVEPHKDGFGHVHFGVFVDDPADTLDQSDFRPVMEAHCRAVQSAGSDAHSNEPCEFHSEREANPWNAAEGTCDDCDNPVSVNSGVNDIAQYMMEYLSAFGESPLERSLSEQLFFAVTWVTNTRRLDFSNGAQEMIARQEFRRETGLRAEDRGGCEDGSERRETAEREAEGEGGDETDWKLHGLCRVDESREPNLYEPSSSSVGRGPIDGRDIDPPKRVR